MRAAILETQADSEAGIPWAMHLEAIALGAADRLMRSLTGVIVGSGGWILSRATSDSGTMTLLFEFKRHACVDIYSGLVGAGIELSRNGHLRFTELCQCTHSGPLGCSSEIASIDLEITTYPIEEATHGPRAA